MVKPPKFFVSSNPEGTVYFAQQLEHKAAGVQWILRAENNMLCDEPKCDRNSKVSGHKIQNIKLEDIKCSIELMLGDNISLWVHHLKATPFTYKSPFDPLLLKVL